MHIVYITNEYITEEKKPRGGLATYLDNITSIMAKNGHQITVIVLSYRSRIFYYHKLIKVICIKEKKIMSAGYVADLRRALLVMENSWNIHRTLIKVHEEDPIDIVQVADCLAVGFFRSYKIPTVLRASGDSAFWREARFPNFDYDRAIHKRNWLDREELFCIKHADSVFAPSKCCADILSKRTGRSIQVIESPYYLRDVTWDYSLYEKCLLEKKYLLFNSSLSYLKGTHLGIRATHQLLTNYSDLYLVYAGADYGLDGAEKSITQILEEQGRKYHGRVLYLGKLNHEQLFPIIENAMACVLPSRIDNLPNSCIESMKLGKIVIGTYGASFEQLIRNKENGLLIKRDSVKALIRAVDYLMHLTEKECLIMGERARDTIKRLAPDIIYKQLIEYYICNIKEFHHKRKKFVIGKNESNYIKGKLRCGMN